MSAVDVEIENDGVVTAGGAGVVTVGAIPPPIERRRRMKRRILEILRKKHFRTEPGWATWTIVHEQLGGRVGTPEMRATADELLEGGELIEVWLVRVGSMVPHALVLADWPFPKGHLVIQARGRPELIRRMLGDGARRSEAYRWGLEND
jgi:hypothetical protein